MDAGVVVMREAMLWEPADNRVKCRLCAHLCSIAEGARGLCGVRLNSGGKLYSLVYGKLISRGIDPIEKKPLYHFMPGTMSYSVATPGCNFFCDFCQNWQISQMGHDGEEIEGFDATAEDVARDAKARNCMSVSYTYTEPTVFFEFAYDTAIAARSLGLKNIFVTNGYQTPETVAKMEGVIDAANVDLKAFRDDFYRERCRARLAPVLESIRRMHSCGMFLEVTTLLVPGENDGRDEIRQIAEFVASVSPEIPWHVSRFHPQYKQSSKDWTPAETVFEAVEIGRASGLKYVYAGNLPAGDYGNTFCPSCGSIVIERAGFSSRSVGLCGSRCSVCGVDLNIVTG
jgi:pyruvate formate lyase activating enzyme